LHSIPKEIDTFAVVAYNGFDDLNDYYVQMSAMGDIPHTPDGLLEENNTGKIHTISIPHCVLQALDDPLVTWKATANNEGFMHPENLVRTGSGNLMLLLTKAGGHVGWPTGIIPTYEKWRWMSDAVMGFAQAVNQAKRLRLQESAAASDDSSEE
jgi:predicted alpha/beta-fold hydrolase